MIDYQEPAKPPLDPHNLIPRLAAGEVKALRQSYMGDADACLKRLAFTLDPEVPHGTGEARIVGTAYHAGLEALYRSRMEHQFPLDMASIEYSAIKAFREEAAGFNAWDTSYEESQKRVTAMLDRYVLGNYAWPEDQWDVLGVEQEWFLPLTETYIIKGTIDLVLRNRQDSRLVLADHKTAGRRWQAGKEHARKNQQATLYCWAWWSITGESPDYFSFDVMTYKGEFERRFSYPDGRHMQATLEKAIGLTTLLESVPRSALPANPTSNLCSAKFCDYWQICPFGQAGADA